MSEVIYARVPDQLKAAADVYATTRGVTLTAAVVDLLERGLDAATNQRSIADLQRTVFELRAKQAEVEGHLQAAQMQLASLGALAKRADQPVGICPAADCGRAITGRQLLGAGVCSRCGHRLSGLLEPSSKSSGLDQSEVLVLLGALGAVLAVAAIGSRG